ncbi:hypothetical protein Tco_1222666 [Tanacetum coccineum]
MGKQLRRTSGCESVVSYIGLFGEQKEEMGIVSVVQLLDPSIPKFDKKYPVSILMSLSHSKKCRKQMVNSGALLFLQKLVEMEVEGAKKLQESIGHAKLWGVFG